MAQRLYSGLSRPAGEGLSHLASPASAPARATAACVPFSALRGRVARCVAVWCELSACHTSVAKVRQAKPPAAETSPQARAVTGAAAASCEGACARSGRARRRRACAAEGGSRAAAKPAPQQTKALADCHAARPAGASEGEPIEPVTAAVACRLLMWWADCSRPA